MRSSLPAAWLIGPLLSGRGGWMLDPLMLSVGAATGCFVALRVSKLLSQQDSL